MTSMGPVWKRIENKIIKQSGNGDGDDLGDVCGDDDIAGEDDVAAGEDDADAGGDDADADAPLKCLQSYVSPLFSLLTRFNWQLRVFLT